MLKIKDDIDLTILETKYGFTLDASNKYNPHFFDEITDFRDENWGYIISQNGFGGLFVDDETREIKFMFNDALIDRQKDEETFYILIKDDIIERIEDR